MHVLGVDIGGTSVKLGIVDVTTGSIVERASFPTLSAEGITYPSIALAERIADSAGSFSIRPATIGVGVPGGLNEDRTVVRYPPNFPNWREEPLAAHLSGAFRGSTISLDNDANVATLAEAQFGAGCDTEHFLLVTLGTGVGGGLFLEGKLYRGATGAAGEFGHISIDPDGPNCACGSKGCLEAYIGQRFLSTRVLDRLRDRAESSLSNYLRHGELDPRAIVEAAQRGDQFAVEQLREAGHFLGLAIATVVKLLDVRVFIIGGGVSAAGEFIFAPARKAVDANVFTHQRARVELRPAAFGSDAGIIGAALLAYTEHIQQIK